MSDLLENIYRTSDEVRSKFAGDETRAAQHYRNYVDFVSRSAPVSAHSHLLDIGCGAGWSSYCLTKSGYVTTGIDLNAAAFEPPPIANLTLRELSALDLPFENASFDVVTAYQTIEHIPDPRAALLQMLRVCKPGGVVCIVGPNLVSPGQSLKEIRVALRGRPLKRILLRDANMPRHPYGNTLPETIAHVPITAGRVLYK